MARKRKSWGNSVSPGCVRRSVLATVRELLRPTRLTDVAKRTGLTVRTVYRVLGDCRAVGIPVHRDPDDKSLIWIEPPPEPVAARRAKSPLAGRNKHPWSGPRV